MKLEYKIENNDFYNIKEVLRSEFEISNKLLTKLKKNKKIFLNNIPCYVSEKVNINDKISIELDFNEESDNIIPIKMNLDIIFEDDSVIIINKSAGVPIHPSRNHYEDSLSNRC